MLVCRVCLSLPCQDFMLYQMKLVYDRFVSSSCCLPPAHGKVAGIVSGPNGEPKVAGLVFADDGRAEASPASIHGGPATADTPMSEEVRTHTLRPTRIPAVSYSEDSLTALVSVWGPPFRPGLVGGWLRADLDDAASLRQRQVTSGEDSHLESGSGAAPGGDGPSSWRPCRREQRVTSPGPERAESGQSPGDPPAADHAAEGSGVEQECRQLPDPAEREDHYTARAQG